MGKKPSEMECNRSRDRVAKKMIDRMLMGCEIERSFDGERRWLQQGERDDAG